MFRNTGISTEFFLVHPGGPFWAKKDEGAWSLPKGEFGNDEDPLSAARRELLEETGFEPEGEFISLSNSKQKSGKMIYAWAIQWDADPAAVKSNLFEIEWPPRSGKMKSFPEIDRAGWFAYEQATIKINSGQKIFIDRLSQLI